ncbi:phosphoglycerate dehydrogenase [Candidatus Roizmanbacteria bacterium]|nr:phosphoglycerate dehydrogenase [Candidatus Roizmanbacteria bacterium]
MKDHFVIDFDSTFVQIETLDRLAEIALEMNPKKDQLVQQIKEITQKGMNGEIPFSTSLHSRLALFKLKKEHLQRLHLELRSKITPSVLRNKAFFQHYASQIYIISGGFREYIVPLVAEFGISEDHVCANTLVVNNKGEITGCDETNVLAQEKGKIKQIKALQLPGKIHVIGDGYSDYEIKAAGQAHSFYLFTENMAREVLIPKADAILPSFDEFLYLLKLPSAFSYPKHRIKVLLTENISKKAMEMFESEGYEVESVAKALTEEELLEKISEIHILCIRSKTEITEKVVKKAKHLHCIGAFCIGTNQINLSACEKKGIAVFNAPYSNTRSVVELTLGEIIMLYRKAFDKSMGLHNGKWDKSAAGCYEIRGKKLGIVGYGNIGSQLSILAEMMGMEVYCYDIIDRLILGNTKCVESLSELLSVSDVISIHVDGREQNRNLIGENEFTQMKDNVIFINNSRGYIVDVNALVASIKKGKIAGCAVDVFPHEPESNTQPFVSELQKLPNVILTPHIGGSTVEAQENIGEYVTQKLITFMNNGDTTLSVNFPCIQLPELVNLHRILHIHRNIPGVLAQINLILAKRNINIEGQYLKTDEEIGYVITDVNTANDQEVLTALKQIPGTLKVRALY